MSFPLESCYHAQSVIAGRFLMERFQINKPELIPQYLGCGYVNHKAELFMPLILMFDDLQEEVAKNLLAEFNLGCDAHQTEHVYRVYVATFLGFGGNAARQRYTDSIFANTIFRNR